MNQLQLFGAKTVNFVGAALRSGQILHTNKEQNCFNCISGKELVTAIWHKGCEV